LIKGAFSLLKAGVLKNGFVDLKRNVGRVWFAGEACHSRYSGYLQGAYLSGKEVAKQLATL